MKKYLKHLIIKSIVISLILYFLFSMVSCKAKTKTETEIKKETELIETSKTQDSLAKISKIINETIKEKETELLEMNRTVEKEKVEIIEVEETYENATYNKNGISGQGTFKRTTRTILTDKDKAVILLQNNSISERSQKTIDSANTFVQKKSAIKESINKINEHNKSLEEKPASKKSWFQGLKDRLLLWIIIIIIATILIRIFWTKIKLWFTPFLIFRNKS